MSKRNFGYNKGYQNEGDGNSGFRGTHPPTNLANEYTEQYLSAQGAVRVGRITEVYAASKACEVNCGTGVMPAIWGGDLSSLDGSGEVKVPNPGDLCLVWKPVSGICVILCRIPGIGEGAGAVHFDVNHAEVDAYTEDRHSFIQKLTQKVIPYHNNGQPQDLLCGDRAWVDSLGGVIALLQGLAILKASPLAQVQCNIIDDLVRIVSRTLEMWHAGGETRIFNDEGEVNYEMLFTHRGAESVGEAKTGDVISIPSTDPKELHKVVDDESRKGLDRLRVDVGHNGDLIHIFIRKPNGEVSATSSEDMVGVAHIRIGLDGAMKIETTKEVVLSKTSSIPTPSRKKEAWDKEGDSKSDGYSPDSKHTEDFIWSEDHAPGKALQEEDQLTYNRQRDVRKYLDHKKDFGTPLDQLPEAEDGEEEYRETQATIHIRSDGSIYLEDQARSSFELTATGSIRAGCQQDFLIEAGRDVVFFAGRNYSIRAKDHIELASTEQDVRLKAEGGISTYSKTKGTLIETDSESLPNGLKGEDQESGGILLRSKKTSPIELRSVKDKIVLHSELDIDCKIDEVNSMFYVEAPQVFFRLLDGLGKFSIECKKIVQNAAESIQQTAVNMYQKIRKAWIIETAVFFITGKSSGYIHAPGRGVNVAHTHPGGEWGYSADAHGLKGIIISKKNAAVPVTPEVPVETTFLEEVDPHVPEVMDKWKFNFLENYGLEGCKWYETVWQNRGSISGTWDLTKDSIDSTEPYPGLTFIDRYTYKSVNPLKTTSPVNEPGDFTKQPKSGYKVGPTSCSGVEITS